MSISHAESALHPVYRISPSLCLRGALVVLPALSLLAAFYAGALPTAMRVALAVFTLFIAVVAARYHWPGAAATVTYFQILPDRRCLFWQRDGACGEGVIDDHLVTPWLVIMTLSLGRWRRRALVLPADALPAEAHRRLRRQILAC